MDNQVNILQYQKKTNDLMLYYIIFDVIQLRPSSLFTN